MEELIKVTKNMKNNNKQETVTCMLELTNGSRTSRVYVGPMENLLDAKVMKRVFAEHCIVLPDWAFERWREIAIEIMTEVPWEILPAEDDPYRR